MLSKLFRSRLIKTTRLNLSKWRREISGGFFQNKKGQLLQVVIAVLIVGSLSYKFWNDWGIKMLSAGRHIKETIEQDERFSN